MDALSLIAAKRDGQSLTSEEIDFLVRGFVEKKVPDYQMAAFLMAAYLNGLDRHETKALTRSMVQLGNILNLAEFSRTLVDKHSSGGVGDKVSLVLLPWVASAGVKVAKMSGRALGHTGGTIDKLESIPGFRADLSIDELKEQLRQVGIVLSQSSNELAPADKKIYALRDSTATVGSIPLIASSIMSKKIAGGARKLVLDVKVGKGAFTKSLSEARDLAAVMLNLAEDFGILASAFLTAMDEPLGKAVGNALEVREAIDCLKGEGPADMVEVCLALGVEMLLLAEQAQTREEAAEKLKIALDSGAALRKFKEWVRAQGAQRWVSEGIDILPRATIVSEVDASESGFISWIDAETVGQAVNLLGGGRLRKEDQVDPSVGVLFNKKVGDEVAKGEPLLEIHASSYEQLDQADTLLSQAVVIGDKKLPKKSKILDVLRSQVA